MPERLVERVGECTALTIGRLVGMMIVLVAVVALRSGLPGGGLTGPFAVGFVLLWVLIAEMLGAVWIGLLCGLGAEVWRRMQPMRVAVRVVLVSAVGVAGLAVLSLIARSGSNLSFTAVVGLFSAGWALAELAVPTEWARGRILGLARS